MHSRRCLSTRDVESFRQQFQCALTRVPRILLTHIYYRNTLFHIKNGTIADINYMIRNGAILISVIVNSVILRKISRDKVKRKKQIKQVQKDNIEFETKSIIKKIKSISDCLLSNQIGFFHKVNTSQTIPDMSTSAGRCLENISRSKEKETESKRTTRDGRVEGAEERRRRRRRGRKEGEGTREGH